MIDKIFVFHLKREFFEMVKSGSKTVEYRFKIPRGLQVGSRIRFDLAYKPLSDESAHLYACCERIERFPLRLCPQYVFECFGLDSSLCVSDSPFIYRICFALVGCS